MTNETLKQIWPEWEIVEKPIGKGSYGSVYKAVRRDHNVESYAAIKVISIPSDESEVSSLRSEGLDMDATRTYFEGIVTDFVSEIQLMESMKGVQNIVSVEDYKVVEKKDEIGWDIYIRMELLTPFNTFIAGKELSEQEVIKFGCDICTALEICGKRNIVHRDIKPENIFINDFGHFKLGDFGIARKMENMTGGLSQKGTFNYMAPEVVNSNSYDAKVDTYSLGIVLYRLLNGNRLPFLDDEKKLLDPIERKNAVDRRIRGEALLAPCNASPAMADVILRACAFDPALRFESAAQMKKALADVENGTYQMFGIVEKTIVLRGSVSAQEKAAAPENMTPAEGKTTVLRKAQEAQQQGARVETFGESPKKKKKWKGILILSAIAAVILIAGIIVLRWYFSPEQKIKRALEDNNIELALEIRDEDLAGEENEDLEKAVEQRIHDVWAKFESGEMDYSAVREELSDIQDMDVEAVSELLSGTMQKVEKLNNSRTAFNTAETMMTEGNYTSAIEQYRMVIESDSNYQTAIARIAEATEFYRNEVLATAQKLAKEKDYVGAIEALKNGLENIPNDAALTEELRINEDALEKQLKETALEDAKEYADKGDYPAAIKLLEKAMEEYPDDNSLKKDYEKYCDAYVAQVLAEVDALLEEKDYAGAITALKNAQKVLPDNAELKAKLKVVEDAKPISLTSLTPINSGEWPTWNDGSPTDPFGNDYSRAVNYAIVGNRNRKYVHYIEYRLYKKYQTITGTLAPYTSMDEDGDGYIQIYVDDELQYTSPVVGRKTDAFTFAVDVSGAEYIKIVIELDWDSYIILSNVQLFPQ